MQRLARSQTNKAIGWVVLLLLVVTGIIYSKEIGAQLGGAGVEQEPPSKLSAIVVVVDAPKPTPVVEAPRTDPEAARLRREVERLKRLESQRLADEAFERAAVVKPEPVMVVPPPAEPVPTDLVSVRFTEAELVLYEKAEELRSQHNPRELLKVLADIQKTRPYDATVQFGLGEIHISTGHYLSFSKAQKAFETFLDLTIDLNFNPATGGSLYSRADLADSVGRLSSANRGGDVESLRTTVRGYLDLLKKRGRLLIMTSPSYLDMLIRKAGVKLAARKGSIRAANNDIRSCNNRLSGLQQSTHTFRKTRITALRKRILECENVIVRDEKHVKVLDAELRRLRAAHR